MRYLALFFLTLPLFAYEASTLEEAYGLSKKHHVPILYMITQEGCVGCEYMEDVVFDNDDVLDYMEKNFVLLIKDRKLKREERFKVFATPTTYFINPDKSLQGRAIVGPKPLKGFIEFLATKRVD